MNAAASSPNRLRPAVGLATAAAVVIGEVIGAGIFLAPNEVARHLGGAVGLILGLWLVCGLVNLCGALALAELSAMLPHAGGTYVFLREAYGPSAAFVWSWGEFWVTRSGSTAAMAAGMTISLGAVLEHAGHSLSGPQQKLLAISAVAVLSLVNILGIRWGAAVQTATTAVKVAVVALLGLLPLVALRSGTLETQRLWSLDLPAGWLAAGGALAVIMFTYDGWGNVTVIAEEIKNPGRSVPRALLGGVLLVIGLYLGANLACHLTLPPRVITQSPVPTVTATETLLPGVGGLAVLGLMIISSLGALNGNVLVGPRVLFAAARDHQRLRLLSRIDPRSGAPVLATLALSGWTILLILAGDLSPDPDKRLFEVLVAYCTFGNALFNLLAVLAVFVLRRKLPHLPRPYRTWGYPIVPAVFCLFYLLLLGSLLWSHWHESLAGLGLIASGLVVYAAAFRRQ